MCYNRGKSLGLGKYLDDIFGYESRYFLSLLPEREVEEGKVGEGCVGRERKREEFKGFKLRATKRA